VEHVYDAAATLLGCHRDEIAVVENATRAWIWLFMRFPSGLATAFSLPWRNMPAYIRVSADGTEDRAVVEVIPNDTSGQLSVEALRRAIDHRVKLNRHHPCPLTRPGQFLPRRWGKWRARRGYCTLLDACQSIGHLPIDVEAIGCDMLSATGRKYLRGPRVQGFCNVRREILDRWSHRSWIYMRPSG